MVFTVDCITGPCNSPLRVNYWMVWSELEIWRMFCKADVLAKSQYWQYIHDSICAGMWIEWTCTQPIHFSFTTSESATCHCSLNNSWWRHQMETFSALLTLCEGNHRSPVNYPHKCQWHGALIFSLICVWTNGWANHRDAGDLRRHRVHYDVTVMCWTLI